jgi:hypothetical protein
MQTNVRNQHYVWRHYLKPWLTDGRIWCYRHGKTFAVNVEKIAKEDYFYRAEPLNESESSFVGAYIRKMDSSGHQLLNGIYSVYTTASQGTEHEKNNAIESWHSFIEGIAIPLLDRLYSNDLSFWDNTIQRTSFCYYVGMQYTRTKKDRVAVGKVFEAIEGHPYNPGDIDPDRIAGVLALIDADAIGNWLFSLSTPSLIKNESSIGFLTSDQPVYNLRAGGINELLP